MRVEGGTSFPERMIGAARLKVSIFEEVRDDEGATAQAFVVVLLAAIVGAIGSFGAFDPGDEYSTAVNATIGGGVVVLSILVWAGFALVYLLVGTRVLPGQDTTATLEQVARTTGFAAAAAFLAVFEILPVIGPLIRSLTTILLLVAGVIAIRVAFTVSTGRAIAVIVVATVIAGVIAIVPIILFSVALL